MARVITAAIIRFALIQIISISAQDREICRMLMIVVVNRFEVGRLDRIQN